MQTVKVARKIDGEMTTLSINVSDGARIEEVLYTMLNDYQSENLGTPEGIAIGPREYYALAAQLTSKQGYGRSGDIAYPTEFMGIKLFPKELPGLEFLIPHSNIGRYL